MGCSLSARLVGVAMYRKKLLFAPQLFNPSVIALVAERNAYKRELEATIVALEELQADVAELKATILERQRADAALRDLYRERAIARAGAVERDPKVMLN